MSDAPIQDDLDDAACRRAIDVLLRVGTAITEELATPSPTVPVTARATAYEAVARAVRFTVLLSHHLARERRDAAHRRTEVRAEVIRAVEDNIHRHARPRDVEPLRRELLERIDAADFDVGLLDRPRREIVAELCNDLGLANLPGLPPKPRRTPADVALLCARAAAPAGSGLPRWAATTHPSPDTPPTPDRTSLLEVLERRRRSRRT